jgi:beta-xylosidase
MKWVNDWPVIGIDKDGDGKGEPVLNFKKPNVGKSFPIITPAETDEFNGNKLGLQWQWHANPKPYWNYFSGSSLRLFSYELPEGFKNYWDVPNLLLQKFPAEEFTATAKITFKPRLPDERFGFIVMGADYRYLSISKKADGNYLGLVTCRQADKGKAETEQDLEKVGGDIYFRIIISKGAVCRFSYSTDGVAFKEAGDPFIAVPGRWIGAKLGFFFTKKLKTNDAGSVDIDWLRIEQNR